MGVVRDHLLDSAAAWMRMVIRVLSQAHLASSLLGPADRVLCCGCGNGEELLLFKNKYKLASICGITAAHAAHGCCREWSMADWS